MKRRIITLFLLLPVVVSAQDFETYNNQANQESKNKNYRRAVELCTQALSIKTNARSYLIRADSYFSLVNYAAAMNDYRSAITHYYDYYKADNKEKGSTYYYLARCEQELGYYTDAINDFSNSLTYNYTETGFVYWNRGYVYYTLKKFKEAEEDYARAVSHISNYELLSKIYRDRGDCQWKLGNYESSYAMFDRALSYNADNYLVYWQKGYNKSIELKYEESLTAYSRAIEIINKGTSAASKSDLSVLYRNKALMFYYLDKKKEGLETINLSIDTDPNNALAYKTRAQIYEALGQYERAIRDYGNAILLYTATKDMSETYRQRSLMYRAILEYKNSLADINKSIELDPAGGWNFQLRSTLYGYMKKFMPAIQDCNTALELYLNDSISTAAVLYARAGHKTNAGDYTGAKNDYQLYIKYRPKAYMGYYELGRLFKKYLKNNDLANANFAKGAEMAMAQKDTVQYCYTRLFSGDITESVHMMLGIVERSAGNKYRYSWNLHNMACFYSISGNTTKALDYLEKTLAAGFNDYPHLLNDRDLESLMKLPQWKTILAKHKVPLPKL
ncbi:MAG: tetratricopeptide repeat protein [Bacteroidota bacterium]